MMKRWLSILLTLCIACTCCTAFAAYANNSKSAMPDVVTFGTWTKPLKNATKAPIEWYVISQDGETATLMSVELLTYMPYNQGGHVRWRQSSLCSWLNSSFCDLAFTNDERSMLLYTNGLKVTIPSFGDLQQLDSVELRLAAMKPLGFDFWWLRDDEQTSATAANAQGYNVVDTDPAKDNVGVRPMITVRLADAMAAGLLINKGSSYVDPEEGRRYITFGSYPQTRGGKAKPIEWLILEEKNGQALVISRQALDVRPWSSASNSSAWKNSSLKKWLCGEFMNTAFPDKSPILKNRTDASIGPVFCLSSDEVMKYFPTVASRYFDMSDYAALRYHRLVDAFWLRDTGRPGYAGVFDVSGVTYTHIDDNNTFGVRPAMWVDLNRLGLAGT